MEMTFIEHLKELRFRLIVSCIAIVIGSAAAFILYQQIIKILSEPFSNMASLFPQKKLFINTIYEGFLIKIKVSMFAGIIISLPVHIYNILKFVFPGLKSKEKKVIVFSLLASFILIVLSGYYAYFKLIPFSVSFLTGTGFIPENVSVLLNFSKNIFFIFQFILVSLLIFQLPIVLELLLMMNLVNRKSLFKASRYIIVVIFILSAVVTPPDIISQAGFAIPLIILFYLTILIAKIFKFGAE